MVPEGSMVTMDFRFDRVRVFVNEQGVVTKTPRTGWKVLFQTDKISLK